ncbi:hypothetical protein WR31_01055 [Burkholderia contaminans LMG 23361]|uniref:Uncharacterized protein n=1 Tax=Burkholderia contaminans LMG 23361 TaxID=1334628 RepID=A0ABD4B224_9BURK|nr:hypothetical protein WR31_01055 [Burkholderia contaminans LMG 23361]
MHQHVGVEHEQLLLFGFGGLAAARLRRGAGIARGAAAGLSAAGLSLRATIGAAGSAAAGIGCSRAAVCFGLRPRAGVLAASCVEDATARSGAAVFAASVIGWATLAGPKSPAVDASPSADFFAAFAGRAFALYSSGGSRLPSLLGGVGKGMVSLGRNRVAWGAPLIASCVT